MPAYVRRWSFACIWALVLAISPAFAVPANKVLFDATKAEMAGNADWVIDADVHNIGSVGGVMTQGAGSDSNPQRFPTPAQSGIVASTPETYWNGALSAWAVALVKRGFSVETLPIGGRITYGDQTNAQDLSNYGIYVVDEPNIAFTSAEKAAIIAFVNAGGGLFLISDHISSDRNNDGIDSVGIWNALPATTFGITINADSVSPDVTGLAIDSTPSDPIIRGAAGTVAEMKYSSGATLSINTAQNASVKGAIWASSSHTNSNVMVAYATYGQGKVVACGDSSPFEDGTGDPGDTLFDGWTTDAAGNHAVLAINACLWLNPAGVSCIGPSITTQPLPQAACEGAPVTLTGGASGTPAPTLQWRKDTANIPGATGPSYTIPATGLSNAGSYDVIATNSCGAAPSNAVMLTVNAAPSVSDTSPATATVKVGKSLVLTASAPDTPTFRWRRNSANLVDGGDYQDSGTMSLTVSPTTVTDSGIFDITASNACGGPVASPTSTQVTVLCRADFNNSGGVTVQDIFDFLGAYFSFSPSANFNGDGSISVQDIFEFLAAWFAPCT